MSTTPLIQTVNLKKYFKVPSGYLHAVDGVSLEIQAGKTLGVVGESGCGKSTLGRAVLRLTEPTDGEVLYRGENLIAYPKHKMQVMRQKLQIIFQDPYSSINPRLSVADIIAEPMIVNKTYPTRKEIYLQVEKLMDIVGLAKRLASAYPHELDGGRRQRIGVARALAVNPDFIVCDEPVSALDVSIQAQILNLLMDLQRDMGLTYMFITHDLSVVKHISDEIMVMYLGQCVERASSKELFHNPRHPYTRGLLLAIPVPDIKMREKKIELLTGEVASPVNPKPGCRFASRCPMSTPECFQTNPVSVEVAPGHYCSCHHVNA